MADINSTVTFNATPFRAALSKLTPDEIGEFIDTVKGAEDVISITQEIYIEGCHFTAHPAAKLAKFIVDKGK